MQTGVRIASEVWVMSPGRSANEARPKSITLGPSLLRITLAGLRSRCNRPFSWIPVSPSAEAPAPRRDLVRVAPLQDVLGEREALDVLGGEPLRDLIRPGGEATRPGHPGTLHHTEDVDLPVERCADPGLAGQLVADHLTATRSPSRVTPKSTVPIPNLAGRPKAGYRRLAWDRMI